MSLIDPDFLSDLFLPENSSLSFFSSSLGDNLNDLFSDLSPNPPKKDIKFILTKEETPQTFLKKKISLKNFELGLGQISNGGRWSKDEQTRFAEAVYKYGNDWKKIQSHIYSRNLTQVRSHAQKFLMKLKEMEFYKNLNLDLNLSWTKVMNYLRANVEFHILKGILFSVEQNEEKNNEKKSKRNLNGNKNGKNKKNKKNKLEDSFNLNNESNCDTNGESSHCLFDSDESSYENNRLEEENESLEKFIECFNRPSGDINLNTSFEEISSQIQEDY